MRWHVPDERERVKKRVCGSFGVKEKPLEASRYWNSEGKAFTIRNWIFEIGQGNGIKYDDTRRGNFSVTL